MASKHVRLTFSPDLVKQPVVYQIGHMFQVVTSIRMAAVDNSVGWVVLELEGELPEIERAIRYAESQGVRVDDPTLGDVVEG